MLAIKLPFLVTRCKSQARGFFFVGGLSDGPDTFTSTAAASRLAVAVFKSHWPARKLQSLPGVIFAALAIAACVEPAAILNRVASIKVWRMSIVACYRFGWAALRWRDVWAGAVSPLVAVHRAGVGQR